MVSLTTLTLCLAMMLVTSSALTLPNLKSDDPKDDVYIHYNGWLKGNPNATPGQQAGHAIIRRYN